MKDYRFFTFIILAGIFTVFGCKSADVTVPFDYGKDGNQKTEVIQTENGAVQGIKNTEGSVELFAGIPFAKPPVGDLRWREPEDVEDWDGILEADHFAPMATQSRNSKLYTFAFNKFIKSSGDRTDSAPMSEDCLYLNIWRPADYDYDSEEKLPVLVYIHGGGLTSGSSWYESYDGETMSKKGLVFVTIAYRVGIFGFLTSDQLAEESPNHTTGNYGLLDQIKALEWINKNIGAFGGDSGNITIAGESAGSSSVNALCVSPLSNGLFRRAIAESSSLCVPVPAHTFRTRKNALNSCQEILDEFGVSSVQELRNIPAEELLKSQYSNNGFTVDEYSMPEFPWKLYAEGKNHEEALLNGFNKSEGKAFTFFTKINKKNVRQLVSESPYVADVDGICNMCDMKDDKSAKNLYSDLFSAICFTYPHFSWTKTVAGQGKPVYEYYFSRENSGIGTMHSGELTYAYGNLDKNKKKIYKPYDYELSGIMQEYWANFAKYGDPNGNPDSEDYGKSLPLWKTACADNPENGKVMELGDEVHMTGDPFLEFYRYLDFDIGEDNRPVTFGKKVD